MQQQKTSTRDTESIDLLPGSDFNHSDQSYPFYCLITPSLALFFHVLYTLLAFVLRLTLLSVSILLVCFFESSSSRDPDHLPV